MPVLTYDTKSQQIEVINDPLPSAVVEETLQEAGRLLVLILAVFYILLIFLAAAAVGIGLYILIDKLVYNRYRSKEKRNRERNNRPPPPSQDRRVRVSRWFYKPYSSAETVEVDTDKAYQLMEAEELQYPERVHLKYGQPGALTERLTYVDSDEEATPYPIFPQQEGYVAQYVTDESPD
ncbi:hypothetical protein FT663_00623 [Candidozyma haemuli var. vulneris]|uniref:Uncharacterized protein n=1 Tax=Candidozyma haemuli TaxID=45357 RepID=A0A2V1ANB4_9ASCO|nr:hypothetical protein CXQ85_003406 [[Candida] haemuloni]KAF3988999.1 hypothetical protein FT662_03060 [[Candida] haemuloni var. vulneris]KAF3995245.1 hypothetical protein FT663_00623 [[Candida] haemuloni var. vulneris]PVH19560.1 hypothetical protein CXQ85_003406 [[Candida] haemuloni]